MTHRGDRTLTAKALARVEGEGAMYVRVSDGRVEEVRLDIYEPPRFFEAFLAGRAYTEPPDITARICGICPVAYQTSACQAVEAACGISLPAPLADLRRLLYCGEWVSSHALHIYMLHAPDFLGYPGAVELARDHREIVERGLALRRVANSIMEAIGGRSIHPVNVRVGGFYRVPAPGELAPLAEQLRTALDLALDTVAWVAGFDFPDFTCDHELLALREPGRYPIERGTLASSGGLAFTAADFELHVIEEQVPHSTALHASLAGLGAVDRDNEHPRPPGRVPPPGVLAAAEHLVLDLDRAQVARAHADERQRRGRLIGGLHLESVARPARRPELLARRVQELLPRLRARRVPERRGVVTPPDPVATRLQGHPPAERQVSG
jgi:sulfhydrogenase subunit alpha